MSKIRNRSVKILPDDLSSLLHKFNENIKTTKNQNVDYFGENIQDINIRSPYTPLFGEITPQNFSTTSNSEIDSITLDLNKLSGLSSSSSLSWSDEYESEVSQKVLEELEKMDRVLRREEPIPLHYDRDEYEQWMNTFPNISVFDHPLTPVNSMQNIKKLLEEDDMELIIYGSDKHNILNKGCDTSPFNIKKKSAVIDMYDSSYNRQHNQRNSNTLRKHKLDENKNKSKSVFTISHKPRNLDTDKYLKIFPIKNQFNDRKLSSKSLINKDINKSYCDTTSLEYNSLPFIKVEESEIFKRNVGSSNLQNRKKSTGELFRKRSGLVLPPIVTPNQFRSISATPRKENKTFSALSMKFEGNLTSQDRSRKSSIKFLDNPMSNR